jgi:predicted membrane protein
MNQRQIALLIGGAILLFLVVAAVVAGLVIGGLVGAITDRGGGLQVRTEQPASIDELRDSYQLETGSLEVNLKDVEFPDDTTELKASVDTGALTVVVPKGVAVRTHAEVGDGVLSILGTDVSGENVRRDYESEDYGQASRRLSLDLSVGTGVLAVVRQE